MLSQFGQIFMRSFSSWQLTDPLCCGPVPGVLSAETLCRLFPQSMRLCSAPRVLHAHMIQFPRKLFFLGRERRSHTLKSGNPDSWVTLPWPTSSPWPGKFVGTLVLFFSPLPSPNSPVAPSPLLSLWGAFQSSPTQTLTQALGSYFSPIAHNTFIFQAASSVRKVDNRHPLIQTPAVSAESVQLAQCRVLPRGWLRILHRKEQSGYHLFFYETCK